MARTGTTRGTARGLTARPKLRGHQFAVSAPRAPRGAIGPSGLRRAADAISRRPKSQWQEEAFAYYEALPEVGYVIDHTAKVVALCAVRLVEETPDGEIPSENTVALDVMRQLVGPRGGFREILRRAALLVQIAGEAHFVGTPVDDESEAVFWEMLSSQEIVYDPNAKGWRRNETGEAKADIDVDTYMAHFWRSDARFSGRPSCALRHCLDTCRQMSLLDQMTEAIISSRLPMGLLLLPETISWQSPLERTDQASEEEEDPDFLAALVEHLSAPIRDFTSAASLVPLVISAKSEDLEKIRVLDVHRDLDKYAQELRSELRVRLAIGLDVPPEILQGKSAANHWTSWNVDNDMLFKHVVPLGDAIADFLTYAYLRPMCEIADMSVGDAARFTLKFDPAPLATKQDDDSKAIDLWARGLISDNAVIEKQGWDPDVMKPDDKERSRRLLEQLVTSKAVVLSDAGWRALGLDPSWFTVTPVGFGGFPSGSGGGPIDPSDPDEETAGGIPDSGTTGMPTRPGRPQRPPTGSPSDQGLPERPDSVPTDVLVAKLAASADSARDRALEKAGNRIITAVGRRPQFAGRLARCSKFDVMHNISREELAAMNFTADSLLDGAWTQFEQTARYWIRTHLQSWGIELPVADAAAAQAAVRIAEGLQSYTVEHFHTAVAVNRDGFKVPVEPIAFAVSNAQTIIAERLGG